MKNLTVEEGGGAVRYVRCLSMDTPLSGISRLRSGRDGCVRRCMGGGRCVVINARHQRKFSRGSISER